MSFCPDPTEAPLRTVLTTCADCETCRFLMDESCLLFPKLYWLDDQAQQHGRPVSDDELNQLADLCTLCGLCPCPDIRANVIRGKARRVAEQGLPLSLRLLADPQSLGIWNDRLKGLLAKLLRLKPLQALAQKVAVVHSARRMPQLAPESFFNYARRQGLDRLHPEDTRPRVAYFVGCTAGYFFPEVARAAVTVLQHNDIAVYVPPQQCCGMPLLVEGEAALAETRMGFNLDSLLEAVQAGCTVVCSCPTCGFLMKLLLKDKAIYAEASQRALNASDDEIRVPGAGGAITSLKKSIYGAMLMDDGYFAALNPLRRTQLADSIADLGEYLAQLFSDSRLKPFQGRMNLRGVYFAPCHQREQRIESPYFKLLESISGLHIQRIGGTMDCCGMGGSLGYKAGFHEASLMLGRPLMDRIRAAAPDAPNTPYAIVTDCLSCRLQFQHVLPYPVYHPLELLALAAS